MADPRRKEPATGEKPKPASKKNHQDELLDEALDETFPASDAVSIIQPVPDGAAGE